ncbi:TetR/AcrR family transcriptional regulator [Luteimonas sp. BDR2-5]|uniref:TetR/AcrR family transcriptional regulator n=1 Tax=Proluteimonas luteida TaxID=2878685 RepID=UPI001E388F32|nr:TetR/AcrR family transcriptional regulator [Luteimonas sp. BDR2-5]MCD9028432.1 TetR/AcrR family transcriptional regulator [Luteimonas sp. BDR2-5]
MIAPTPALLRRQRDIAAREQAFLDRAQVLIQRDGLLSLQMARIADDCGFAIGTLYKHFASKEDLLVALATRNCMSRVELFERAARWDGPTREKMLAVVLADLIIMREQPEHFRLAQFVWTDVVWGAASAESRRRALAAFMPLTELIDGIATEARARGDLPATCRLPVAALTMGTWMLTVGMHTLAQQQGMIDPRVVGDPYRLLLRQLQYLLNGYGWQPLFDADDDALDALVSRIGRTVFDTDWRNIAPVLPPPLP